MIYISGPVRRRPGLSRQHLSRRHLQRNLSERQPERSGLEEVVQAVLFPGGIPGHVAPETPGSVHEASELGYSLSHDTFGAVSGNPDLIVACVIGDGEAETGPLATASIIPHPFYAAQIHRSLRSQPSVDLPPLCRRAFRHVLLLLSPAAGLAFVFGQPGYD